MIRSVANVSILGILGPGILLPNASIHSFQTKEMVSISLKMHEENLDDRIFKSFDTSLIIQLTIRALQVKTNVDNMSCTSSLVYDVGHDTL